MRSSLLPLLLALTPLAAAASQIGAAKRDAPATPADPRVGRLLDEADVRYTVTDEGDYGVNFTMGGGRTQVAIVRSATSEYDDLELREIWSYGYEAPPEEGDRIPGAIANRLLEENNTTKMGGWARQGGHAVFVLHVGADTDASTLSTVLQFALRSADTLEEELSGDRDAF